MQKFGRLILIFCLILSNTILSNVPVDTTSDVIKFSKGEIEYIHNSPDELVYIGSDVQQATNELVKKGIISTEPDNELYKFAQACKNKWKVVPLKVADTAINQISDLLSTNKDKFSSNDLKDLNSIFTEYKGNLDTKEAQFFYQVAGKEATRDISDNQAVFNNLVVKNFIKLTDPSQGGIVTSRITNDRARFRVPVTINFQSTDDFALQVKGSLSAQELLVRDDARVRGTLNVNTNINVANQPVILNAGNLGTGEAVFSDKAGNILNFKTLVAGSNVTLSSTNNAITISAVGSGMGDVTGPSSATNNAIARFDGISGKVIDDSLVKISDAGNINTPGNLNLSTGPSTATAGMITQNSNPFVHNAGKNSFFAGLNAGGSFATTPEGNTGIGKNALAKLKETTGELSSFNTAVGFNALANNEDGAAHIAIGPFAMEKTVNSAFNVAIGANALRNIKEGQANVAIGFNTLISNIKGDDNIAIGHEVLGSNKSIRNIGIGSTALSANEDGERNTAVGDSALQSNVSGTRNTAIGAGTLAFNEGNNNIALGNHAGINIENGDKTITIGHEGNATDSNLIRIGDNDNQTKCFIAGIAGSTGAGATDQVYINPNSGRLSNIQAPSSKRYKKDIEDIADATTDNLYKLKPVKFKYNADVDSSEKTRYGLIAEQVLEAGIPELVKLVNGQPESVDYNILPILLLNELKKLRQKVEQLEAKLGN